MFLFVFPTRVFGCFATFAEALSVEFTYTLESGFFRLVLVSKLGPTNGGAGRIFEERKTFDAHTHTTQQLDEAAEMPDEKKDMKDK